ITAIWHGSDPYPVAFREANALPTGMRDTLVWWHAYPKPEPRELPACDFYWITRGSIISISAARSASAAAISFAASLSVLVFGPQRTTQPRNAATDAAIVPRSNRIAPTSIAASTMPPPVTAIREAKMNFRQLSILAQSSSMRSSRRTISSCSFWANKFQYPWPQSEPATAKLPYEWRPGSDPVARKVGPTAQRCALAPIQPLGPQTPDVRGPTATTRPCHRGRLP